MKKTSPHILVLGSSGMLGRVVYGYLEKIFSLTTYGTTREKSDTFLYLDVKTSERDFENMIKKVHKIDYVSNCIGALRNTSTDEELHLVNTAFPHMLAQLAETYGFNIIHFST